MKERFNPFIVRRVKQIDELVDEVYNEVTPCDYDEDKFYIYFREITNWVVENFVIKYDLEDDNIAIDLHHFIRERYFEEFLDYFENAQLSCNEHITESEEKNKDITPSDLKKIDLISDYIESVSNLYLNKQNYRPCFVGVTAVRHNFYIITIGGNIKYTLDGYDKFIMSKLRKIFKGFELFSMLLDGRNDEEKSCEDWKEHISKVKNTIIVEI